MDLMATLWKACTFPMERTASGTSFSSTLATTTGTAGGGPAALVVSFWAQPARSADRAARVIKDFFETAIMMLSGATGCVFDGKQRPSSTATARVFNK